MIGRETGNEQYLFLAFNTLFRFSLISQFSIEPLETSCISMFWCFVFQKGNQLQANFVPMDVKLKNFADLPDLLLHPENFILVARFVKQWQRYSYGIWLYERSSSQQFSHENGDRPMIPKILVPSCFVNLKNGLISFSLSLTKQRLIIRSGAIFSNPCLLYGDLASGRKLSKQRYTSKVRDSLHAFCSQLLNIEHCVLLSIGIFWLIG